MTNKISILEKNVTLLWFSILFMWLVICLIGVVEYGYLRDKQKEIDRGMTLLEMNVATHHHH